MFRGGAYIPTSGDSLCGACHGACSNDHLQLFVGKVVYKRRCAVDARHVLYTLPSLPAQLRLLIKRAQVARLRKSSCARAREVSCCSACRARVTSSSQLLTTMAQSLRGAQHAHARCSAGHVMYMLWVALHELATQNDLIEAIGSGPLFTSVAATPNSIGMVRCHAQALICAAQHGLCGLTQVCACSADEQRARTLLCLVPDVT